MSQPFILKGEECKQVNDRLRELKPEWISEKTGAYNKTVQYIGSEQVAQILNYATYGVTTWEFSPIKEWKEEVYQPPGKNNPDWKLAGVVYHVKGELVIHGVGKISQYGKKIAQGGVNQQDSAYQAAASTALSKCAAWFGVGEKLYSKNQIELGELEQKEDFKQSMDRVMNEVDQDTASGNVNYPFENTNQAQPNDHQAQPQGQASQQQAEAKQMGAPVNATQEQEPPQQEMSADQNFFNQQNSILVGHMDRLGVKEINDEKMLPYLRDFFQDEKANGSYLSLQTIQDFNHYLTNIQA